MPCLILHRSRTPIYDVAFSVFVVVRDEKDLQDLIQKIIAVVKPNKFMHLTTCMHPSK